MELTIFEKIRENVTSIERVRLEPEIILPLCNNIKSLTESVNSATDIDFCIDSLEIASTLVKKSRLENKFWKRSLLELAGGLSDELGHTKDESSWKKIEPRFNGIMPYVLSLPFLYNNVKTSGFEMNSIRNEDNQKIPKVKTSRRLPLDQSKFSKPIEVHSKNSNDSTLREKMEKCLEKLYEVCSYDRNVSVPFLRFAINCRSYVQTVYNIFTLSFLFRENLALVSIDENDELWIRPVHNYQEHAVHLADIENDESELNHQSLIVSINPREWKMLVSALKLDSTVLPELWPSTTFSGNCDESLINGVSFLN